MWRTRCRIDKLRYTCVRSFHPFIDLLSETTKQTMWAEQTIKCHSLSLYLIYLYYVVRYEGRVGLEPKMFAFVSGNLPLAVRATTFPPSIT